MLKTTTTFVALALALLLGAGTAAAEDTGNLEGTVALAGEVVAGARVVVESASSSSFQAEAVSDAEGRFQLNGVPLGAFTVRVLDADDVPVAEGTGTLEEAGETVRVHLAPTP